MVGCGPLADCPVWEVQERKAAIPLPTQKRTFSQSLEVLRCNQGPRHFRIDVLLTVEHLIGCLPKRIHKLEDR